MRCSRDICRRAILDNALIRLFTARIKLGMFDPPEMVPYTKIDEKELDSAEHRAHARKLANESMVLLKNDGLLPLKPSIKKIAVVGPTCGPDATSYRKLCGAARRISCPFSMDSRRSSRMRRSRLCRGRSSCAQMARRCQMHC